MAKKTKKAKTAKASKGAKKKAKPKAAAKKVAPKRKANVAKQAAPPSPPPAALQTRTVSAATELAAHQFEEALGTAPGEPEALRVLTDLSLRQRVQAVVGAGGASADHQAQLRQVFRAAFEARWSALYQEYDQLRQLAKLAK